MNQSHNKIYTDFLVTPDEVLQTTDRMQTVFEKIDKSQNDVESMILEAQTLAQLQTYYEKKSKELDKTLRQMKKMTS